MSGRLRSAEQRRVRPFDQGMGDLNQQEPGSTFSWGCGIGVAKPEQRQRGVGKDRGAIVEPAIGKTIEGGHTLFIYSAREDAVGNAARKAESQLRGALDQAARGGEQVGVSEGSGGEGAEARDIALAIHVPLHVGEAGGEIGVCGHPPTLAPACDFARTSRVFRIVPD